MKKATLETEYRWEDDTEMDFKRWAVRFWTEIW
jgi:hypothetical protein